MEKTLYERLGGAQTISDIIEKTYDRVLADPLIGKHFDNTDIISLMGAFKCFFARAFVSKTEELSSNLREAHKNMGLKNDEFKKFWECMLESMQDLKIEEKEIEEAKKVYFSFQDDIVTA